MRAPFQHIHDAQSYWFRFYTILHPFHSGMASWGFPSLVLPSIERRFAFSAKELGLIAASNDVSALLIVVFISYYGDYGNKIRLMSGGALVTGIYMTRLLF